MTFPIDEDNIQFVMNIKGLNRESAIEWIHEAAEMYSLEVLHGDLQHADQATKHHAADYLNSR